METRFHPSEITALDAYARTFGLTREQALQAALHNQSATLSTRSLGSSLRRRLLGRWFAPPSTEQLRQSVIVVDDYQGRQLVESVRRYQRASGCRSRFAVPRHALAAELLALGLVEPAPLPTGFGERSFC
jgi:hypothetical protein